MSTPELEFRSLVLRGIWILIVLVLRAGLRRPGSFEYQWRQDAMKCLNADAEGFPE